MTKKAQSAVYAFLVAAEGLAASQQIVAAELKYLEALRLAEKEFGADGDQVILVLSILAAFYHGHSRHDEALLLEKRLQSWHMDAESAEHSEHLDHKFVGTNKTNAAPPEQIGVRPPANLRQACQILGLSMERNLTIGTINGAWKKQMLASAAHPDLGGNTEEAVLLNRAKETLIEFLESRQPNLGAKFKK